MNSNPLQQLTDEVLPQIIQRLLSAEVRLASLEKSLADANLSTRVHFLEQKVTELTAPKQRKPRKKKEPEPITLVEDAEPISLEECKAIFHLIEQDQAGEPRTQPGDLAYDYDLVLSKAVQLCGMATKELQAVLTKAGV